MNASQLKKGSVVSINKEPYVVENLDVKTPSARGAQTLYKVRFRNLITGQKLDKTFHGDDQLEETTTERKPLQYLYKDEDFAYFMDLNEYGQYQISLSDIEYELNFMVENMDNLLGLFFEGKLVSIILPATVALEVVETPPAVKGNSVTARTKPAKLITGFTVQVPEYIEVGDKIRVNTETGEYTGRD